MSVQPRTRRNLLWIFMYIFELVGRMIFNLLKQVWLLPQTIARNRQQDGRQTARDTSEAERLDRIRNPWKYLGK